MSQTLSTRSSAAQDSLALDVEQRPSPKTRGCRGHKVTPSHTATLARRLNTEGAASLIDRRQGQKQEYRVPPPVKAELVQQFAVDIITSGQTSGSKISSELKDRCNISVPARTVRYHLAQMGLGQIKQSLPQLLAGVKKTSNKYSST